MWSRWQTVDQSTVDAIRAVPGVATVDGRVVTSLPMLGRDGRALSNGGAVGVAVSVPPTPPETAPRETARPCSPSTRDGLPVWAGETAVDRPTAEREGLDLNDTVTVLDTAERPHPLLVVGLVDFGPSTFAGFSAAVLTTADLRRLTPAHGYSQVAVRASDGTDPGTLRRAISTAVGPDYEVLSGAELRARLARDSVKYVDGLLATLQACALVALVVAGITVHNTFSILMAQRAREFALLRCLGATRRQLFRAAAAESLAVGLVASAGGVGLSLVAARAILLARGVVGGAVPEHSLVLSVTTVLVAVAAGTASTVLCGLSPALRAARTAPLVALRRADLSAGTPGRTGRRKAAAGLLAVAGAALTVAGAGRGFAGTPFAVGGVMAVFVAVVMVLPLAVGWLTAGPGWLAARLFGATGRLAWANARRQPQRTAAAVATLMTGVAVMSMFAVVLATAGAQGQRELAENFPVDFVVSSVARSAEDAGHTHLPDAVPDTLRARPEFRAVARTRETAGLVDGADTVVAAVESPEIAPEVVAGSLADLTVATVALRTGFAGARHLAVGDTVQMGHWPDRGWPATVVALIDDTPTRATRWSPGPSSAGATATVTNGCWCAGPRGSAPPPPAAPSTRFCAATRSSRWRARPSGATRCGSSWTSDWWSSAACSPSRPSSRSSASWTRWRCRWWNASASRPCCARSA